MNSNPMKPRGNRAQTSTVSTMTMMPTHRLWPNDQLNRLETQLPNLLIISSNHSIILSQSFLSSRVSILPKREVKSGIAFYQRQMQGTLRFSIYMKLNVFKEI